MPAFISHSFKDEAVYTAICLAVDAAGIKRWDPGTMSAGEPLADQLRDAIRECEVCVFIVTRRSIESPWCLAELGAFWGAGKRVLLFMVDPDLSDSVLPPQFKGNLRVNTAQELIRALAASINEHGLAIAKANEIRIFPNTKDLYTYAIKKMDEAKETIDDLTWGLSERERTPEGQKAYEEYVKAIKSVCSKGNVSYREVMSFPAENHFNRADSLLRQDTPGYHLRYYEVTSAHHPPLISFMVVDSEEVILGFYRSGVLPVDKEVRLAVRHPDIARLFTDYYDAIWQGARPMEGAKEVTLMLLQEIRQRLSVDP